MADIIAQNMLKKMISSLRKSIITYGSDAVVSDIRLVPFDVTQKSNINRVTGHVSVTQNGKLMQIGIYDANFNLLTSTEVREIPAVGDYEMSLPQIVVYPGKYYLGFTTNATTAQFGVNTNAYLSVTGAFPLPSTITQSSITLQSSGAFQCGVYGEKYLQPIGFSYSESNVRVYGINTTGNQPWGWNTATGKLCYSTNSGASFTDAMPLPSNALMDGGSITDLLIYNSKVYLLISNGKLLMSSDLTSSATWSDVSCPTSEGLRHSQAVARPYGIAIMGTNLYQGEYSTASTGEFTPDGPRILRMDLNTNTWSLSKEFPGARHIHSFYAQGSTALYVSLGDAGYSGIGLWRLVPAGVGTGAGGTDSWTAWTSSTAPFTNHYPVDFILLTGITGAPDGLYCTSDRPGKHILYSKTTGTPGAFNLSAQSFQRPGGPAGETVRSMIADASGNIYFWTAETTEQALYFSPPPYTQSYKLKDFGATPQLNLYRAIVSGGYIMMFNQRFSAVKHIPSN